MSRPIILIHGYSDSGPSFKPWKSILCEHGIDVKAINVCDYKTLTNEVTIKDLAEAFDRALRLKFQKEFENNANFEFDAIVHSTGMLVLRSWLCTYPDKRLSRLKHLIGLAPASFGSPLAYKGRSWIGSLFKGNRKLGPDFMEAGDKVLDALELGSFFTWNLAHKDLINESKIFYGPDPFTPYVFIFIGNKRYGKTYDLITKAPGTDGTVRHAGCSLNTRKISIDFTKPENDEDRYHITPWGEDIRSNIGIPFVPIAGLNHATILNTPTDELIEMVINALKVDTKEDLKQWNEKAKKDSADTYNALTKYQQFIVHCEDERGDGISDFHIQLYKRNASDNEEELVDMDMHPYSTDNSYRCYHVKLTDNIDYENLKSIRMELTASSGTELIGYSENQDDNKELSIEPTSTVSLDITDAVTDSKLKFFYPFTTTLLELTLNREPLPPLKENKIVKFIEV